ncbi:hypothetical protein, partial [Streptomyces zhihengii]|uniref:hypothetical protein n=1 Tax=Streptomyces zhihengii TaxID=1818004 RepID=UPI00361C2C6C
MKHETTINELAQYAGLFSAADHITVPETHPDTGITDEVTLPPPLIRHTQRRDDTIWWILTPPGIHERIFVADQAPRHRLPQRHQPRPHHRPRPPHTRPPHRPPGNSSRPPPPPTRPSSSRPPPRPP